jgi:hypothetical protein
MSISHVNDKCTCYGFKKSLVLMKPSTVVSLITDLMIIKVFFILTNGCTIYLLRSILKFTLKFTIKLLLRISV